VDWHFLGALGVTLSIAGSGCGRIGFDFLSGPGQDASSVDSGSGTPDASRDAATMATEPWDGNFTLGTAESVTEIASAGDLLDCSFSRDGLTLHFGASLASSLGGQDFYSVSRPTTADAFSTPPDHLTALSTTSHDGLLYSHDDLEAFFASDRSGTLNLWSVERASTAVDWDAADAVELVALSAGGPNLDPWVSNDGLRIYWNSIRSGGVGGHDIYTASRATTADPFGAATLVGGLNTVDVDANIGLSSNELFAVFTSNRGGDLANYDLYYARRAAIGDPFDAPIPLTSLNLPTARDWEPCLSPDGFIYFSSDRPGGSGGSDVYRAEFIPQ
jgi:Tol biopolymer transport system component